MAIGTAANFKVADVLINGRSNQRVAKRPVDTGGGGPEWVPADAKIYIDLVNDRAWTEADGEVAIDTLLGTDANTENGWDTTEYNPSNLMADGYFETSAVPTAFIGAALLKLLDSFTMVTRFKLPAGPRASPSVSLAIMSANGNDGLELDLNDTGFYADTYSFGGAMVDTIIRDIVNSAAGAINQLAWTVNGSRDEFAVNGSDPAVGIIGALDRPVGNPLVAALFFAQDHNVQSITIYDALPSTAGLSALSETGQ